MVTISRHRGHKRFFSFLHLITYILYHNFFFLANYYWLWFLICKARRFFVLYVLSQLSYPYLPWGLWYRVGLEPTTTVLPGHKHLKNFAVTAFFYWLGWLGSNQRIRESWYLKWDLNSQSLSQEPQERPLGNTISAIQASPVPYHLATPQYGAGRRVRTYLPRDYWRQGWELNSQQGGFRIVCVVSITAFALASNFPN